MDIQTVVITSNTLLFGLLGMRIHQWLVRTEVRLKAIELKLGIA